MTVVAFASVAVISQTSYGSTPTVQSNKEIVFYDSELAMQTDEFKESMVNQLKEEYGDGYASIVSLNSQAVEASAEINDLIINDNEVYPDYYGGMYINDNQRLVVQIVNNNVPALTNSSYQTYNNIMNDDNVVIEYVNYSYNELNNINDSITEYFSNNISSDISISRNYIDVYANKVIVELSNNTSLEQQKFKDKVSDSELIVFRHGERSINALNSGQGMYYDGDLLCTLGFRAKRNGKSGFVTAGHCVQMFSEGSQYYSYGKIAKNAYKFGTPADAAFIENSSVTNNLQYPISTRYPAITSLKTMIYPQNLVAGTLVGMNGAVSHGKTGKITQANVTHYVTDTYTLQPVQIKNQVMTDIKGSPGDSGGVVFTIDLNPRVVGVVQAMKGGTDEMSFSTYSNISSELGGITRY